MGTPDTDFFLTGNAAADALLASDANAVLIGMVLDQQVTMEKAFSGPAVIADRMGGTLDVAAIAAADPAEFVALCSTPPAVHRFPGSMAGRVQAVARELVEHWDGRAENLYAAAATGEELKKRIAALPGFGAQKAAIFVALLGKRFGVQPAGWAEAAGPYGVAGSTVSVADVADPASLQLVRAAKKAAKAAAKTGRNPAATWSSVGSVLVDRCSSRLGGRVRIRSAGGISRGCEGFYPVEPPPTAARATTGQSEGKCQAP